MQSSTKTDPFPSTNLGPYCQTITSTLPGREGWRVAYFGFNHWRDAVPMVEEIKAIRRSLSCQARESKRLTICKFEIKVSGQPTREEVKQIYLALIQPLNPTAPLPWIRNS